MRTIVKGKNLDVTDLDREYVELKMQRVGRLLDDRSEAVVELSIERHRSQETSRIVEVSLIVDGVPLRSEARAATHRAAVDIVIDQLERQTVDHKERPRERSRSAERRTPDAADPAGDGRAQGTGPDNAAGPNADAARIVKVKRFAIEPMFEEDALGRMQELGHSFFLFVNAENERVALLYQRKDGDYGLIEPAIGGTYTTGRGETGQGDRRARSGRS